MKHEHEPYQIIVMRPTSGKPAITIRPFWTKLIFIIIMVMIVSLIILSLDMINAHKSDNEQKHMIELQSTEIHDLNISLAHKDEEIISLKNKLSMAITHTAVPIQTPAIIKDIKETPPLQPAITPIVKISELSYKDGDLSLKIEHIKPDSGIVAKGYFFAVYKKGDSLVCYPEIKLENGVPTGKKQGISFTVRRFKPVYIKNPRDITGWESVTFYIFDMEGNTRLVMPINKEQLIN